jgi:hypothetical protein
MRVILHVQLSVKLDLFSEILGSGKTCSVLIPPRWNYLLLHVYTQQHTTTHGRFYREQLIEPRIS